jgi:5'-nucleotidase (lipoprotein e(P4) family)
MIYHDNFDGTSFNQTAAEYLALCQQTFRFAAIQLSANLKTIAPDAKPCVIFDLDETILDNSAANAALIRDGQPFEEHGNWKDWCNKRQTALVTGSKEFVLACAEEFKVEVFFITSRLHAEVREATKADLIRHGLPVTASDDPLDTNLFMKGMGTSMGTSYPLDDKFQQRDFLTKVRGYKVALIIGDNLGDWLATFGNNVPYTQRVHNFQTSVAEFERDFILVPNPMYGSWIITLNQKWPDSAVAGSLQPVSAAEAPRLNALHFPL